MTTKTRILIVEDREENRAAANQYFQSREDLEVDFATSFSEAIEKLEQTVYAGAIVDIEFPREPGEEPQKIGLELGKKLDIINGRYRTPHLFLTAGADHHGPTARIYLDEFCYKHGIEGERTSGKKVPETWKIAFESLEHFRGGLEEIMAAKLRFQRAQGRVTFN